MEFWLIIGSLIFILLLMPYIVYLIKRTVMYIKIRQVCKSRGFKVIPTRKICFLGSNSGPFCDFYIECPDKIFSVKLFGLPIRVAEIVFATDGTYFTRRYLNLIKFSSKYDTQRKPRVKYDFRKNYRDEWADKATVNILLINPAVYRDLYIQLEHGAETIAGAGDTFENYRFECLSDFLNILKNNTKEVA